MESNPSKTIRYDLLVVIVGVAYALAAEPFVRSWTWSRAMAALAFYLTSLNFLHGKTVALDDEDYNRALTHRPGFAFWDFFGNVAVVSSYIFMALYLDDPEPLLWWNIVVRLFDTAIVIVVIRISQDGAIKSAQKSWLRFDWFAITVFGTALAVPSLHRNLTAGGIFLVVILLDLLMDYTLNSKMYFSSPGSWSEMADIWDAAQGRDGDIYRRRIIVPGLQAAFDFEGTSVLDLGCGNGCVARALEKLSARSVVALEKYQNMIDCARLYLPSRVSYLPPVDLEFSNSLDKGGFDVIVAVFTLQDCDRLDNPLELIRNSLAPHGRALIVLENDAAFEGEGRHITTSRKPLDGESQAGAGRRWLIFWDSHFPALAQSDTRSVRDQSQLAADPNFKPRVTITRHWSIESYLETAAAKKLEPAKEAEELHVSGPADSYLLQRYELKPKFSLLTLRRREDIPEHRVKPLPLILIAGASGTGKTALARHMALQDAQVVVVNLDDFYLDEEAARRIMAGEMPDWESSRNIDLRAAARAVDALVRREEADIPIYDMARSAVDGQRTVSAANARVIVVEGLFAFKLFAPSANQITRVVLEGSWLRLCYRRLKRDAAEKRRRMWPSMVLSLRLGWQNRVRRKTNRQMANYTYPCALPAAELATRIRKDAGLLP